MHEIFGDSLKAGTNRTDPPLTHPNPKHRNQALLPRADYQLSRLGAVSDLM